MGVLVDASLVLLGDPLNGTTVLSPPITHHLGQQTMEAPITLEMILLSDDPCAPIGDDLKRISGRAVYLPNTGDCSYERQYDNLLALGAAAIVLQTPFPVPGYTYNAWDGETQHDPFTIPFLHTRCPDDVVDALMQSGSLKVSLSPDINPWAYEYGSWQYIFGVRVIPALIFAITAIIAVKYLLMHLQLARERTPAGIRRTHMSKITYHHCALIIQAMTSIVLCIITGLTGKHGSGILSHPIQIFFLSDLNGLWIVSIFMSSIIWNRIRYEFSPSSKRSWFRRVIVGDFGIVAFVFYMLVLSGDMVCSYLQSIYYSRSLDIMFQIRFAIMNMAQLVIAIQFLYSAARFQIQAKAATKSAGLKSNDQLSRYLSRARLNAIAIGFILAVNITSWVVIVIRPLELSPFTLLTIATSNTHASAGFFLVLLLKPRRALSESKEIPSTANSSRIAQEAGLR